MDKVCEYVTDDVECGADGTLFKVGIGPTATVVCPAHLVPALGGATRGPETTRWIVTLVQEAA